MKVALVHYWLVGMRGGERVLEALSRMFPDADIYTNVVDRSAISKQLSRHKIHTSFIQKLPCAERWYQKYVPFMPAALEALDLTGYDLIISSEAGPAKGIIPGPDSVHICYCHSPMRYIWDQYHVYRGRSGALTRLLMLPAAHYLRIWDASSSLRVDTFLANSDHVRERILKYYRRDSTVVFPPVAVNEFAPVPAEERGDYYLWAGELVSYKRPDLAIAAFRNSDRKLVVIGDGPERKALERESTANISFLGKVSFAALKYHFARCRALIFPGEEDFGIIPVEVQSAGRPVIALGRGGVLNTVVDGQTGILFNDSSAESLIQAIDQFEASGLEDVSIDACVANAARFDEAQFVAGMCRALDENGFRGQVSADGQYKLLLPGLCAANSYPAEAERKRNVAQHGSL